MNEENRHLNAEEELARAKVCLTEARTLHDAGLPFGAASRSYYAVFHAGCALLLSVGLEPRSHRGMVALLNEHFVKTGRVSPATGRVVSRLQRDREDADYLRGAVFTLDESSRMLEEAEGFVAEVRSLLAAQSAQS